MTDRRVDQLAHHLEQQLFFGGAGDVARTKLLLEALDKRPAIQKLRNRRDAKTARLSRAMAARPFARCSTTGADRPATEIPATWKGEG